MRSKPFQYCVLWILAATSVGASFDSAMATSPLRACAARDRQVLMAIEERENANGISPQASIDAMFAMMHARITCNEGHVVDALALYDRIAHGIGSETAGGSPEAGDDVAAIG